MVALSRSTLGRLLGFCSHDRDLLFQTVSAESSCVQNGELIPIDAQAVDKLAEESQYNPPEQENSSRQDVDALLEVRSSIGAFQRHCANHVTDGVATKWYISTIIRLR